LRYGWRVSQLGPESIPERKTRTNHFSRRCILGLLGAAGASLFVPPVAERVTAVLGRVDWRDWVGDIAVPQVPPLPGSADYAAFLGDIGLRRVAVSRILASHAKERSGICNALPPRELWRNLAAPLQMADALAGRLGEDVLEVISAYRSPEYNAMCPGAAKNSQHVKNAALDLVFRVPPAKVASVARALRAEGLFRGGVGLYKTFTHIDTRGYNADW
jgi:hypothetical protein